MKKINLKTYYSIIYKTDTYMNVPMKIADLLIQMDRQDHALNEKRRNNKAYYSLDLNDGIELQSIHQHKSPEDIYIQRIENDALYKAILSLTEKQMKRVYAYYFLGLSVTKIAQLDRVNESTIRRSIEQALRKMKKDIKKSIQ